MVVLMRWMSAILAVLTGLPLLFSAVLQSATKIGYDERPTEEISANFLAGSEYFIDEAENDYWSVGYSRKVLTPDNIDSTKYFLGGYLKFPAQEVTGVIDDLCVRAVVLDDNSGRGAAAFAWIDCVGLLNADIKDIREKLSDITGSGALISIDVGSTHTHSGIDTQGLWGNIPYSGRNQEYIDSIVEKTAAAIREAYNNRTDGTLYYGSESCPQMFYDGRSPYAIDENIHLFRFVPNDTEKKEIYIANFGAHPVNLDYENSELSGDFPYYVEQNVINDKDADFIFIQGAIGGGIYINTDSRTGISDELTAFEKMIEYSEIVSEILYELAENAIPVEPILNVSHAQVDFEVNNFIFLLAESAGLCNAHAFKENGKIYLTSEVGYIEIGKNIKIIEAPGEAMPELIYGGFYSADKAYNGTEYPYPALNTYFSSDDEVLVFGLCNDALGYIVPDNDYSSSNEDGHYEETVSTGSYTASAFSVAVANLIDSRR